MRNSAPVLPAACGLCCLLVASLHSLVAPVLAQAASRPDIILIMSDDMGFSDIGCYGGEIRTPNLDSLAGEGLRFTQFYNTARCCPTRASLLTGLYPHQAGVGHMMSDRGHDGYRGNLNRNCVTIAEVLKEAGYGTYIAGKWHVTRHTAPDGPKHNWPLQRGFDRFYGTIHGAGSFYDPNSLTRDNTQVSPYNDPEYQPEQYYYTDAISDHAVRFIADHAKSSPDRPLFMYVSYTAAHWPMHALKRDIAKYKGAYDQGYAAIRRARFERLKRLGLIDARWKLTPPDADWDAVKHREWEVRCMEVYAAMVDCMDQGIGRIVAELRKHDRLENTLILFFQDNGGCAEGLGRSAKGKYTERPERPPLAPMPKEALQFSMIPKQTRDGYPVVQGPGVLPGPPDTYIAYGRGWANTSNTPFREYKHWVHEGGIATPLIAHWPARITRRGELESQPAHLIDLMTTCVEIAGATYPSEYEGHRITPMEGRSLTQAFAGETIQREAIYWEHEGNRAIRAGKWKLVAKGERGPWELYDMEADRTETNDLASSHSDVARKLAAMWQAWAERAKVLPLNPGPQKAKGRFSKKKRFKLKQGDDLPRERAPHVDGKSITITARVKPGGADGVILAQGGTAHGYAIYVKDGELEFATRLGGKLTVVKATGGLPSGGFRLSVQLAKNGTVTLKVNDKIVTTARTPSTLIDMPVDGLQVGQDANGAVGEYEAPNVFGGTITSVELRLSDG